VSEAKKAEGASKTRLRIPRLHTLHRHPIPLICRIRQTLEVTFGVTKSLEEEEGFSTGVVLRIYRILG
jgi:hypothetical protein